ncbi:MAG: hypothetical protein MJZ14_05805 [Paludibacteraceae bacterium]|nr:hypothetical protein [Paludibacteraceae bacterium]
MKSTKFIIAALLPAALWLGSCGDDYVDNSDLGRTLEFPEMSEHERGMANGEVFGSALLSLCDSIKSARHKEVLESPVFSGMITPPLSKLQRPYELYVQNENDSLWVDGFKEGVHETASIKKSSSLHGKIMNVMSQVNFEDIDKWDNALLAMQIEELLK